MSIHFHDESWSLPWGGWGRTAAGSSGTSEGGRRYGRRSGGRVGTGLGPPCPSGPSLCRPCTPVYSDTSIWGLLYASGYIHGWNNSVFLNVTHLGLTEHLQTVLTDELQQLAVRQAEELIFFGHLGHNSTEKVTLTTGCAHFSPFFFFCKLQSYVRLTSLKCVLMYSRLRWCSSVQPISSAKRAMPMTLAGSRCLVRKSQHALATSSTWYLVENNRKRRENLLILLILGGEYAWIKSFRVKLLHNVLQFTHCSFTS